MVVSLVITITTFLTTLIVMTMVVTLLRHGPGNSNSLCGGLDY